MASVSFEKKQALETARTASANIYLSHDRVVAAFP
jgi:hypothetical protein